MSKFTKGPWTAIKSDKLTFPPHVVRIFKDDKGRRCTDYICDVHEERDVNLIATAPDLYNVLDAIVKKIAKDGNVKVTASDAFQNAVKALEKADGDKQ